MFNVLVNNNLFDKKNFRLLTLNNDYNNKMLLFILLSNYNQNNSSINLTEFSSHDLNKITNTLKKDLNKHVKNKYNINYLNLNNKNHLNILSNLFEINLKIFNKNFNETKFMSDTNHNKSMYFLERNNKLHLVSTKNKNNIQYHYNNILYGGGYDSNEYLADLEFITDRLKTIDNPETDLTIGLFQHYNADYSFYSLEQVNKFLMNQQTQIQKTGNHNDYFKEIFTATFTNIFRNDIYIIIDKINKKLDEFVKLFSKDQQYLKIDGCKLIIGGGDCFNSFLFDNDYKPISPDIDVKLVIESEVAKYLHNQDYANDNQKKKEYTLLFNLSLLIIRNKLYEILDEIVNDMNSKLEYYNDIFVKSYQGLLDYMQHKGYIDRTMDVQADENIFITKYGKRIKSFKKRFNHMESGYKKKNKLDLPFTINNVLLYSIDGLFENEKTTWTGLAGILDIVISLPTHTGYMLDTEYESFQYRSFEDYKIKKPIEHNFTNLYRMTKNYYTNKDNLKMVDYGLRTLNKKILKDFTRILILIKYDYTDKISNKGNIIQKIINKLNELKTEKDYESHINEIDNMLKFIITCLGYNLTGGANGNNIKSSIRSNELESYCSIKNIFKSIGYDFEVDDDDNIYDEEIYNNSNNSNNLDYIKNNNSDYIRNNNSNNLDIKNNNSNNNSNNRPPLKRKKIGQTGGGGFIKKPNYIDQIQVSYKLPKALYYMISEKILSDYPDKDKKKILNPIINFNKETNTLDSNVKNINYEKLTELTEGVAENRPEQLKEPLILNELFNSDALYRFKNTSYNRWTTEDNTGILKIKPEIVELLTHITNLLNTNPNNIQKLYYFDIININTTNVANYNNTVNKEVAKCLMHTFMHSLSPEYMQIDDIYRRFFKNTGKKRNANNNNVINSKIEDIKNINELQSILNFYNKIKQISEL